MTNWKFLTEKNVDCIIYNELYRVNNIPLKIYTNWSIFDTYLHNFYNYS